MQATAANRPLWRGRPRTLGTEAVTNGRFTSDTVWTKGTGWTIAAGAATKAAGTAAVLSQTVTLTPGVTYMVMACATRSAGTVLARFTGGTTVSGVSRSANGSYYDELTAVAGNTTLELSADAAFAGTIKNVTVRPVATMVNMGASFNDSTDMLATGAINLSASDKATAIVSCYLDMQDVTSRTAIDVGNFYGSVPGSFTALAGLPIGRLVGSTGSAMVAVSPGAESAATLSSGHYVIELEIDLAGAAILDEVKVLTRGIFPGQTASGTIAGAGNLVNGALNIGATAGSILPWIGEISRVAIINKSWTGADRTNARDWVREGKVFAATIGDSTVGFTNPGAGLPNAPRVSTFCGGLVTGAADLALQGDHISQQKTAWNALGQKTALEAVFIQVGLNDILGGVGAGTSTTAQVIAAMQDLVDTVNAAKPAGCKTYICGLIPCKLWLNGAVNAAAAYSAWLAVNEAIAGNGATPITGVDARITSHVAALNDGADSLLPIYDYNGDGVHESCEARFIIAQAWRAQLEADGLV